MIFVWIIKNEDDETFLFSTYNEKIVDYEELLKLHNQFCEKGNKCVCMKSKSLFVQSFKEWNVVLLCIKKWEQSNAQGILNRRRRRQDRWERICPVFVLMIS